MRRRPRTITFDHYVKTSDDRLHGLIEKIADATETAKDTPRVPTARFLPRKQFALTLVLTSELFSQRCHPSNP